MAHDTTTPSTDVPEQGAHYELTVCEHICYGPQGELLKFQRSSTEIGRQQASYLADARSCAGMCCEGLVCTTVAWICELSCVSTPVGRGQRRASRVLMATDMRRGPMLNAIKKHTDTSHTLDMT